MIHRHLLSGLLLSTLMISSHSFAGVIQDEHRSSTSDNTTSDNDNTGSSVNKNIISSNMDTSNHSSFDDTIKTVKTADKVLLNAKSINPQNPHSRQSVAVDSVTDSLIVDADSALNTDSSSDKFSAKSLLSSTSRLLDDAKFTQSNSGLNAGYTRANLSGSAAYRQDTLRRLTAVASISLNNFSQSGLASWYGEKFQGKKTASGELFDANAMTAAHHSLAFGSFVKVTNKQNGKSVVVKINDRMPASNKRVIDLSYGAAKELEIDKQGVANVTLEKLNLASRRYL